MSQQSVFEWGSGNLCKVMPCEEGGICCQRCTVVIGGIDITGSYQRVNPELNAYGFCVNEPFSFCDPCEPNGDFYVSCVEATCAPDLFSPNENWTVSVRIECLPEGSPVPLLYEGSVSFSKPCPPEGDGVYSGNIEVRNNGTNELVCTVPYTITCRAGCAYDLQTESGDVAAYEVWVNCYIDDRIEVFVSPQRTIFTSDQVDILILLDGVEELNLQCPAGAGSGLSQFIFPGNPTTVFVRCLNTNTGDGSGGGEPPCTPRDNTDAQYTFRSTLNP